MAFVDDIVLFVLITLAEGYLFWRLKFRVDRSGLLTLLLYWVASLFRFLYHILPDVTLHSVVYEVFITMCQILIWVSLYYFTFEMRLIQLALLADTPQIF